VRAEFFTPVHTAFRLVERIWDDLGRGVLVLNSHLSQVAPHFAYFWPLGAGEFSHVSTRRKGDLVGDKQRTGRVRKFPAEAIDLVSRTAWTFDAGEKRIRWDTRLIDPGRCLLVTPLVGRPRHSVATCDHHRGNFRGAMRRIVEIMKWNPPSQRNQFRRFSTSTDGGAILRVFHGSSSIEQI
jgi:hypothetical protein